MNENSDSFSFLKMIGQMNTIQGRLVSFQSDGCLCTAVRFLVLFHIIFVTHVRYNAIFHDKKVPI